MKKRKPQFTASQVREAVRVFKGKGGTIKMLPDEIVPPRQVGGWEYSIYKSVR